MRMSPEIERQYEENRLRMKAAESGLSRYFKLNVVLGALIFSTALFAGAFSTLHDQQQGPGIFYFAMSAGVFQILMGVATIALSFFAASRHRVPSLILLGLDAAALLAILVNRNGTFSSANIFFMVAGLGLGLYAQKIFNEFDELKECPGYPLFSVEADTPAEYEAPLHVTARRSASVMETIGEPVALPPAPEGLSAAPQAVDPLNAQFAEMDAFAAARRSTEPVLRSVEDVQLEAFIPAPKNTHAPEPVADAEAAAAMLSDMTPETASRHYAPDEAALPSPEEVRARLAAMKRERQG